MPTNAELKALLVKVRPAFVAHLEHAKRLQTTASGRRLTVRIARFAVATCLIAWVFGLSAAERPGSKTHTVTVDGMRFQPDDLTVASGDTVVWVNKDLVAHTATSETGGFDSRIIQPEDHGRSPSRRRENFPYVCRLHPTMQAMLRVK